MYEDWTEEQIRDEIAALTKVVSSGVASVSHPGGGQVQYVPQAVMERTLAGLRQALRDREASTARLASFHRRRIAASKGY